jgi:hypothetical protein
MAYTYLTAWKLGKYLHCQVTDNYSTPKQEYNSDLQIGELLSIGIFRAPSFWPMRPRGGIRFEREISNAGEVKTGFCRKRSNANRFF